MKYYSIRAIEANSQEEAVNKVEMGHFDETDPICDAVIPKPEMFPDAITGTWDDAVYYPVHGTGHFETQGDKRGLEILEQCEPEEAEFWSVYLHLDRAGLTCVADVPTEEVAKKLTLMFQKSAENHIPDEFIRAYQHFLFYINPKHLFKNVGWDQHMHNHFEKKLDGFIHRDEVGYISMDAVSKWVQEISHNYQRDLFEYICKFHWRKW